MSKLTASLGIGVAVAAGTAIFIQQHSSAEPRGELALDRAERLQAAKQQARVAGEAKARAAVVVTEERPAAPVTDKGELAQLREEVNGLKQTAVEFGKVIQAAQAKAAEAAVIGKDAAAVRMGRRRTTRFSCTGRAMAGG